jgi:hypothetical protein
MQWKLRTQDQNSGPGLLCTYLHPPLGADEVSGESWQHILMDYMCL